jgi:mRNA-degrading endonuclease RelE of RelBE toxin-antitoxin system
MTRWDVEWTPSGSTALRRIHWRDAGEVAAAVAHFAETSEGDVQRLSTDHAVTMRLRVGSYRVLATLDPWDGVMRVWFVYRA